MHKFNSQNYSLKYYTANFIAKGSKAYRVIIVYSYWGIIRIATVPGIHMHLPIDLQNNPRRSKQSSPISHEDTAA